MGASCVTDETGSIAPRVLIIASQLAGSHHTRPQMFPTAVKEKLIGTRTGWNSSVPKLHAPPEYHMTDASVFFWGYSVADHLSV